MAVDYEASDGVARVTFNLPERKNALSAAGWSEFNRQLHRALSDDAVRVVVLTGAGDVFTSGGDISALVGPRTEQGDSKLFDVIGDTLCSIVECTKPVVARVNGDAIGAGSGIVAASDLAIATDSARFGFPEIRVGLISSITGVLLSRAVGRKTAYQLALCGNVISADDAKTAGLINSAVAAADFERAVDETVKGLASLSPIILAHAKRTLAQAAETTLRSGIEYARAAFLLVRNSEDSREGLAAFLDKREPAWPSMRNGAPSETGAARA